MPTVGIAPYNVIAIVNKSSFMNDVDGETISIAINTILPIFCNDWTIPPVNVTYVKRGETTVIPLQCVVLDSSDVEGALGYHGETTDIPYARVFVKTILEYGGKILHTINSNLPTVAATISHEVLEMIVDLRANVWWGSADGNTLYAAEVCDPVQGNVVSVQPKDLPMVGLSDWILPAWADPQARVGPYNHTNTLTSPMTMDKGGYLITITGGKYGQIFGSEITSFTRENLSRRGPGRS